MDLTIDVENYRLNIRAASLIIHDNKVLTHKNLRENSYALVGGRVELGEDSATTVKREVFEEIGKEIELNNYATTIENFFDAKGKKYHEILFVHGAEFTDEDDKKITHTLKNIEGKDYLQYEWLDIDKIDEYPLKPKAIKKVLKDRAFPVHVINKDK